MEHQRVTGSCLCGAVRFAIPPVTEIVACHCKMCRRQTTHYLAAIAAMPWSDLDFSDRRGLAWYQSSPEARRGFCRDCGSLLFWANDDRIAVSAGALDDDSHLHIAKHVYTADKGAYYEITDGAQCFAASHI